MSTPEWSQPGWIKTISSCNWSKIKSEWLLSFEDYTDIGSTPNTSVDEVLEANNAALPINSEVKTVQAAGIKNSMIREAVFLTHKSIALIRSYNRDISGYDQTYPELTAYTSAFFLCRSITLLLGCSVTSKPINNKAMFLNCRHLSGRATVNVKRLNRKNIGHIESWSLFQELVTKTIDAPFDMQFKTCIGGMTVSDFAKARNKLQYHNCEWTYLDLHIDTIDDLDWINEFSHEIYQNIDPDDDSGHFNITLSLMLLRAMLQLLQSIAVNETALKKEYEKLIENLDKKNNCTEIESWIS